MRFLSVLFVLSVLNSGSIYAVFWQQPNGPRGGHVMDIIRTDDGTLYLGTFTTGVFRSRDNANSWESVNQGLPLYDITCLTTDAKGDLYAAVGDKGVYVSTDHGDSWTSLSAEIENEMIQTIFVDYDGTIYIAPRGKGIYKTTDGGKSWESMGLNFKIIQTVVKFPNGQFFAGGNDGIYRLDDTTNGWEHIRDIPEEPVHTFAYEAATNSIYAGTYGLGVLRSRNNGDSWTYVNNGFADVALGWIEELAIDDDNTIYASVSHWYYGGLYYSTDEGENWTEIETDISHKEFHSILVHEDNIFLGVYNYGLYHSLRPFHTWEPRNNGLWFFRVDCLTSDSIGDIYAGTPAAGLFRSQDDGRTWKERNMGINIQDVRTVDCTVGDRLYMGILFEGIYFSDTYGDFWTRHISGLLNLNFNCLAHNSDKIFLGTDQGLYISEESGNIWEKVSSVLSSSKITTLHIRDEIIYAGTNTGKIMMSSDNGQAWTNISAGLPIQSISSIVSNDKNELFVAARTVGVFKSTDYGKTWMEYSFDLPTRVVNVLASFHNDLYAGTDQGVFFLDGERWESVNDGLWDTNIHDLHTDRAGFLWAATDIGVSKSLKKLTVVEKQTEAAPYAARLESCFPNPFNAATQISFTLPNEEHVLLEVYDISGRLVTTLIDEKLQTGNHRTIWRTTHQASGIYVVRLTTEHQGLTEKIILQK
jgi:photosystem II stability/assembly factor-like uncharacterized protein